MPWAGAIGGYMGNKMTKRLIPAFIEKRLEDVTRLETIDNTICQSCNGEGFIRIEGQGSPLECPACHGMKSPGRTEVFFDKDKHMEFEIQDNGRTLKIFINERKQDEQFPF